MCQQWLSILGVAADLIGFILISIEWYRSFTHTVEIRNLQLQDAFERNHAREQGLEPTYQLAGVEETMAREFSKVHNAETNFRKRLFIFGVGLVCFGFLLQALGTWPVVDPIFGLKNC
jgi:hypothetical protein